MNQLDLDKLKTDLANAVRRIEELEAALSSVSQAGGDVGGFYSSMQVDGFRGAMSDLFTSGQLAKTGQKVDKMVIDSKVVYAMSRTGDCGPARWVRGVDDEMHPVVDAYPEEEEEIE